MGFISSCLNPSPPKILLYCLSERRKTVNTEMAWRCGSLPRTVVSAARSSSIRSASLSTSSLPRFRPSSSPLHANRLHSRRPLVSLPARPIGALGCIQSLMPLHSVVAATRLTSHISVEVRACCELSQGT